MSAAPVPVEIVVQDAAGARLAIGAGATRLELCQALDTGGITPSLGILESVAAAVDPSTINLLVRPRGGGFTYSAEEAEVVATDIRAAVARGVGGVVVGALDATGAVDLDTLRRWQDAAAGTTVVFHRAIDAAVDPDAAFEALLSAGIGRVLTSGAAARAIDGIERLSAFAARGAGAIEVMAGGGVQVADIPALIAAGVHAVHLSARVRVGTDSAAGPGGGADGHDATSAETVAAAVAAARG